MSSTTSTSLISNPDYSSAGALPTSFTTQCAPSLFQVIKTTDSGQREDVFATAFKRGMQNYLSGWAGTTGEVVISESMQGRMISHYYLTHLPDAAVREACETLQTIWGSYIQAVAEVITLPAIAASRKGKIRQRYESPSYSINVE